ncbi:hypothetical protein [Limnohabitans sp. Jir72]|uniref:hypothetical protein n=1 Tax=Limnohabitans sp. Jir72 TaxID=1977909 RepID=UPI000D3BEC34|nr:hypothetical protein [Limnohabitans sp. Jir72]PUE28066.1 hypothetical protein B9Z52_14385 [Limnohabitans sp. Jir72]
MNITEAPSTTSEISDIASQQSPQAPSAAISAVIAATIKPIEQVYFLLENLEAEREKWEITELAASHKRLYEMLTKCYAFYLRMKTDTSSEVREQSRKGLNAFIAARSYTFKASTHDMNRVVKAVFGGVDRRRVSAYSTALRAALVGVQPDAKNKPTRVPESQLSTWLEDQGGVEEVRLGSKNKGMTPKARAEKVETVVRTKKLMSFAVDEAVMQLDTNDNDKPMVLIATYRPTGEFDVHVVVKNDSAVNAAYAAYYTDNKKELEEAEQTAAIQSKEDQKQAAIELAAAQA